MQALIAQARKLLCRRAVRRRAEGDAYFEKTPPDQFLANAQATDEKCEYANH
ncbi:MAG TPA: hypothetical protein VH913_16770 [Hyphomicrobiaceae bacterium]|jgi:hypothetical protein